jgi:hypothetical protein
MTLAGRVEDLEADIAETRAAYNGHRRREQHNAPDVRERLDALVADHQKLSARVHVEQAVLSATKLWLDRLPSGTMLEPVTVATDGHDLASVRARIKAATTELDTLKRAPAPSSDIEARVRDYVAKLAPAVRGVGVGEHLSIVWPGAQLSSTFLAEQTCDPLALLAALFPDRLIALAMREAERQANDPLPVAERAPRIAVLEHDPNCKPVLTSGGQASFAWNCRVSVLD